jgi:damage-control phosphatase, subfamily I
MQIWPDCIPCILKMSLGIARVVMKNEDQVRRFMGQVIRLKYFNGEDWRVTSPEVIKDVWLKVIEVSGKSDPLKEIKDEQNKRALAVYPKAKESVLKSKDPFLEAMKLAIAGNSIDAMTDVKGESPEEIIKRWNQLKIDNENFNILKERLKKTRRLVYLGDNCGEIVFDRLLIEVLLAMYRIEITFITRTLPILNDATLQDALSMGIGSVAQVMGNGLPEPIPGTYLKRIGSESKTLIERSDLVISKGGGNYDSLTEEKGLKGKVSFLFLAKCYPYCNIHHVTLNAPVIYNF